MPPGLRRELAYLVWIASLSLVVRPAGSQSWSLRGGVQVTRAFAGLAAAAAITEGQALTHAVQTASNALPYTKTVSIQVCL